MLLTALHYIAQLVSAQHCTSIPPQAPIQQDNTEGPCHSWGTGEMEQRREAGGSLCDACLLGTQQGCEKQGRLLMQAGWALAAHARDEPIGNAAGGLPVHSVLKSSAVLSTHSAKSRVVSFASKAHPAQ